MGRLRLKPKEEKDKGEVYNSSLEFILENLPINKFKLDEEATKQVELLDKISKLLPKAKELALSAKNRLEIIESDLAKQIRKRPKEFGLDKVTDTVVYKETKCQPEYRRAFSVYLFAKTKEDEYTILLDNIRERGRMIKILTELWLNNYYSVPTTYVTKRKRPISMEESE